VRFTVDRRDVQADDRVQGHSVTPSVVTREVTPTVHHDEIEK